MTDDPVHDLVEDASDSASEKDGKTPSGVRQSRRPSLAVLLFLGGVLTLTGTLFAAFSTPPPGRITIDEFLARLEIHRKLGQVDLAGRWAAQAIEEQDLPERDLLRVHAFLARLYHDRGEESPLWAETYHGRALPYFERVFRSIEGDYEEDGRSLSRLLWARSLSRTGASWEAIQERVPGLRDRDPVLAALCLSAAGDGTGARRILEEIVADREAPPDLREAALDLLVEIRLDPIEVRHRSSGLTLEDLPALVDVQGLAEEGHAAFPDSSSIAYRLARGLQLRYGVERNPEFFDRAGRLYEGIVRAAASRDLSGGPSRWEVMTATRWETMAALRLSDLLLDQRKMEDAVSLLVQEAESRANALGFEDLLLAVRFRMARRHLLENDPGRALKQLESAGALIERRGPPPVRFLNPWVDLAGFERELDALFEAAMDREDLHGAQEIKRVILGLPLPGEPGEHRVDLARAIAREAESFAVRADSPQEPREVREAYRARSRLLYAEAGRTFREAADAFGPSPTRLNLLVRAGLVLVQGRDFDGGVGAWERYFDETIGDPRILEIRYRIGRVRVAQQKYPAALVHFERNVHERTGRPVPHWVQKSRLWAAHCRMRMREWEEADGIFEGLLADPDLFPDSEIWRNALLLRGVLHYEWARFGKPSPEGRHRHLLEAAAHLGEYRDRYPLDPRKTSRTEVSPEAYFYHAALRFKAEAEGLLERWDLAVGDWERLVGLEAEIPDTDRVMLAEAYRRLGRYDEAEKVLRDLKEALDDGISHLHVLRRLARLYRESGQGEKLRALQIEENIGADSLTLPNEEDLFERSLSKWYEEWLRRLDGLERDWTWESVR